MQNRAVLRVLKIRHISRSYKTWKIPPKYVQLLLTAAIFHIIAAIGIAWAGHAQIAPSIIDHDGIVASFAFDSYEYQSKAKNLVEILHQNGIKSWAMEPASLHVKLISIEFAVLGPLFGYTPLCAEPINLLSYILILALVLALGREIGGESVGFWSAVVVALFPTLLLHTLQLLKDALFIAGVLSIVLCISTWLTRKYNWWSAVMMSLFMSAAFFLVQLIRPAFIIAFLGFVFVGLFLLFIRQLFERKLLYWNTVCPVLLLILGAGILSTFNGARQKLAVKHYPSNQSGQLKEIADAEFQVPAELSYKPRFTQQYESPLRIAEPVLTALDYPAQKIGIVRSRFAASYSTAGSGIDREKEFKNLWDLIDYLPRAFEIGSWAPFPNSWLVAGVRIGNAGKLLSGAETMGIYLVQLLAFPLLFFGSRRLTSWLLISISFLSFTALGLVIPNVGAIYRFRYAFWILLIILGIKGFLITLDSFEKGTFFHKLNQKIWIFSFPVIIFIIFIFSHALTGNDLPVNESIGAPAFQNQSEKLSDSPLFNENLTIINQTGVPLRGIYLSPSSVEGWEENIIEDENLLEENVLVVKLNPEVKVFKWDLKIEGLNKHYAEWKNLKLDEIRQINLFLGRKGEKVAVAEIE